MTGFPVTFVCYWGGNDSQPFDGPDFLQGPKCFIRANSSWSYNELIDKLYKKMRVNRRGYVLDVICRFPHLIGDGVGEYFPIHIEDDDGMNLMYDTCSRFSGLNNLQLYVIPKLVESQTFDRGIDENATENMFVNSPFRNNDCGYDNEVLRGDRVDNEVLRDEGYNNEVYRDDGAGVDTQNFVSTQTTNYETGQSSRNMYGSDYSDSEGDYSAGDDEDEFLENSDEDYLEGGSDSDHLSQGLGGPGDDDDGDALHVVNIEASGSRVYERADYPFYRDIGDYARQEEGMIDFQNESVYPVWDPENQELAKGVRFSNKGEAQYEIKRHHILTNHRFKVRKSSPTCWVIECLLKKFPCDFLVRLSRKKTGFWEVTKYRGPHKCLFSGESQDHPNLDSKFIGRAALSLIRKDADIKVGVIIAHINEMFHKNVGYKKAWCGKQKGIAEVYGDWTESYARLPRVLAAIKKYNPGTIVEYNPPPPIGQYSTFHRVFWAFGPCIEAFSHCRPVISVDGTFLHGRYKGVILIAMGVDANDSILPLAFAIVSQEDRANWYWFLHLVIAHIIKGREVCLISDRHGGILSTVRDDSWPSNVHHRYCLRHLRANFLEKHHGTGLKFLFWRCGTATQTRKVLLYMDGMKSINPECLTFFDNLDARKWSLNHDGGYRYGIMTTNLSEVFNGVLKGARGMPITAIVETAFYRCVEYFNVRHGFAMNALGANEGNLNPRHQYSQRIHTRYLIYSARATKHTVRRFNTQELGVYQVTTARDGLKGGNIQIVRMNDRTCTCGKWKAFHLPCSHLLACTQAQHRDGRDFVDAFYTIQQYYLTWKGTFEPLEHEDYWGVDGFVPRFMPNEALRRAPKSGRPRSRRIRNSMDFQADKRTTQCSACHQEGHNRRRCPSHPQ